MQLIDHLKMSGRANIPCTICGKPATTGGYWHEHQPVAVCLGCADKLLHLYFDTIIAQPHSFTTINTARYYLRVITERVQTIFWYKLAIWQQASSTHNHDRPSRPLHRCPAAHHGRPAARRDRPRSLIPSPAPARSPACAMASTSGILRLRDRVGVGRPSPRGRLHHDHRRQPPHALPRRHVRCDLHEPDLRQPHGGSSRGARRQPAPHLPPRARPAADARKLRGAAMGRGVPRAARGGLDRVPPRVETWGDLRPEHERPHSRRRAAGSHQVACGRAADARLRLHAPRARALSRPAPRRQRASTGGVRRASCSSGETDDPAKSATTQNPRGES